MEGVKKVHEMEMLLFQDGFIPDRLHELRQPIFVENRDHNYSSLPRNPLNQSAVNISELQFEEDNIETNNDAHGSEQQESENIPGHRIQLFYGLLDLEKTMLQAISTLACDGNVLLDALVYMMVIPMSGMYMIR